MIFCGEPVRGMPGETCKLPKGHKGRKRNGHMQPGHSCVVFTCDSCGRTLPGTPHTTVPDGPWWEESGGNLQFCFLCVGFPYRNGGVHRNVNPDNPYDTSIIQERA